LVLVRTSNPIKKRARARAKIAKKIILTRERESVVSMSSKQLPVKELDVLSHGHQGAGIEVLEAPELNWETLGQGKNNLLLGLDGIEDPQNLGAILRSAWVFGATGILLPSSRAMGMTPTVAKVASGGAEHVPVDIHSNLLTPLQQLKAKGFWIFALSEKGDSSLWKMKIPGPVVWVVGAEGTGVKKSTLSVCDEVVQIPQVHKDAALNASVATAITLAETRRQWFST
jgi:23S rRNA (guanosine2251-2'-O)-methyltransferase